MDPHGHTDPRPPTPQTESGTKCPPDGRDVLRMVATEDGWTTRSVEGCNTPRFFGDVCPFVNIP